MTSDQIVATPPSVSWAQRSARVLLTINVECDKPDIKFETNKFYFKGVCAPENKMHEVVIPLYADIDPEKCTYVNKGRFIDVIISKLKTDQAFWPSLTSDRKKYHWLKVDFERWQEEDESEEDFDEMNDMFSNKMPLISDEDDKDDSSSDEEEDLPDIE